MNDKHALTAVYFGVIAATIGESASLDRCWSHAEVLAEYALRKLNVPPKTDSAPVRMPGGA